jgi:polyhydroxybutyrate depolymerase
MNASSLSRTIGGLRALVSLAVLTLLGNVGLLAGAEMAVPQVREWTINGVRREAMVYLPASQAGATSKPAPVIFAFHGHGGTMRHAARSFALHEQWPEAIVVYPQGLNTAGQLTDPDGKKSGWQPKSGVEGDRDLAFFDEMLASLKRDYAVDAKRIYATGHSNGGGFTYLLWSARPQVFAAFAPVAAVPSMGAFPDIPKPVIHVAGRNDPLVKFTWQERTIKRLCRLNGCGDGRPWSVDKRCTIYDSDKAATVVTYIHDGGHSYPEDAAALIVKFFKEDTQP